MNAKDVANKYGLNYGNFTVFLKDNHIGKLGMNGYNIPDFDVQRVVEHYKTVYKDTAEQEKLKDKISPEEMERKQREMILTTCPGVDGYKITEQHGLVFGEMVMKMGFLKSLGASIENIGAVISFGDNELTGTSNMMEDAREYAINKMTMKAITKGANAIVGIDSETTMGGDVIKISIMGTAVKIEKENSEEEE